MERGKVLEHSAGLPEERPRCSADGGGDTVRGGEEEEAGGGGEGEDHHGGDLQHAHTLEQEIRLLILNQNCCSLCLPRRIFLNFRLKVPNIKIEYGEYHWQDLTTFNFLCLD